MSFVVSCWVGCTSLSGVYNNNVTTTTGHRRRLPPRRGNIFRVTVSFGTYFPGTNTSGTVSSWTIVYFFRTSLKKITAQKVGIETRARETSAPSPYRRFAYQGAGPHTHHHSTGIEF